MKVYMMSTVLETNSKFPKLKLKHIIRTSKYITKFLRNSLLFQTSVYEVYNYHNLVFLKTSCEGDSE